MSVNFVRNVIFLCVFIDKFYFELQHISSLSFSDSLTWPLVLIVRRLWVYKDEVCMKLSQKSLIIWVLVACCHFFQVMLGSYFTLRASNEWSAIQSDSNHFKKMITLYLTLQGIFPKYISQSWEGIPAHNEYIAFWLPMNVFSY